MGKHIALKILYNSEIIIKQYINIKCISPSAILNKLYSEKNLLYFVCCESNIHESEARYL